MSDNSLTITDNRTGATYTIPVTHGAISALDLRQIKVSEDDFGLISYDPGFKNTANTKSRITFIDGDKGILRYRGYAIERLAEECTFLEVAFLILHGELPTRSEYDQWVYDITHHTMVHENLKKHIDGFRHDAHPMGMLVSTMAALSTFYPDARNVRDRENRQRQIRRIVAKIPTLAAFAYRHSIGRPYIYPNNDLSYTGNILSMLFSVTPGTYTPHPVLERALDVLFILHADHEQNCSTNAMRSVGSSEVDPYSALAAAAAALYGPLHGGANEQVLRMLRRIGRADRIPEFLESVRRGEQRLMGFGHRVYRSYDPRAQVIKKLAHDVFEVTGRNPLIDIATELEKIALEDEYFVKRRLYPNVDFYSGLIYEAMGFPTAMFPVLFALPRTIGWLTHWNEMLEDPEQKLARPRQIYLGEGERPFVYMADRGEERREGSAEAL